MASRPLKLAIIGAGPSAFYAASRILSLVPNVATSPPVRVHLFDRLWSPHGLVRYGVAPDHPEVKVSTRYIEINLLYPEHRTAHINLIQRRKILASAFLEMLMLEVPSTQLFTREIYRWNHSSRLTHTSCLQQVAHSPPFTLHSRLQIIVYLLSPLYIGIPNTRANHRPLRWTKLPTYRSLEMEMSPLMSPVCFSLRSLFSLSMTCPSPYSTPFLNQRSDMYL